MSKPLTWALAACIVAAGSAAAMAENVRHLTLTPGKGVSFYMGSKHGMTLFKPDNGACDLTVTISENPDQTGMAASTASRVKMAVVPGRPARVETAEGQSLVFSCNPDVQSMVLDMPADFKYVPKG